MRLQSVGVPDSPYRGFADTHFAGHAARAPVRGVGRRALGGLTDYFQFHGCGNRRLSATPRRPPCNLVITDAKFVRNLQIGLAFRSEQHDSHVPLDAQGASATVPIAPGLLFANCQSPRVGQHASQRLLNYRDARISILSLNNDALH